MNYKIAVVILNYMSYEDTLECIQSVLSQTYINYDIIVVENGSQNDSYQVLLQHLKSNRKVTILKSNKNLGFAKGNNVGIRYARERLKADYVFVCNSDITFQPDLFETILKTNYKGIGVISPTIYNSDGMNQPVSLQTSNIYKTILNTVTGIFTAWLMCIPFIKKLAHIFHKTSPSETAASFANEAYTYRIQGCSYFLTPIYFKYYHQLYPKTFLYWEEINLAVYLSKAGLKAVITETSPVIHKDKKSFIQLVPTHKTDIKKLKYSTDSLFHSLPLFFSSYSSIVRRYDKLKN
jgi:GT2 family glycosyltransferase